MRELASSLAKTVGPEILGPKLSADVRASIREAREAGTVFPTRGGTLAVFRATLASCIRDIEDHDRGRLLQRFLLQGPYEDVGDIPAPIAPHRLSDGETAAAIAFVYSFMVNSFKGALAELLACRPCLRLLRTLQAEERLPASARFFAGDAVEVPTLESSRFAKGADLHLLNIGPEGWAVGWVDLLGAVEVKSYPASQRRVREQIERHVQRGSRGLRILGTQTDGRRVRLGGQRQREPVAIVVVPGTWRLSRAIAFDDAGGREVLRIAEAEPPGSDDRVVRLSRSEWRITLRWSEEALASAAYEMTFWYMAKVGEVLYRDGVPHEWPEMSPAEAGQNAVKMMLYYAILRARSQPEEQRAIALYNTYGFGHALGMSFRNQHGRREMLWPEDLYELVAKGVTRHGCRLFGSR